jgi:hypothetical protein
MTKEGLAGLAGLILSLVFSYVPGVNTWFGKLDGTVKRLIMGALIVVVALGAYGLSCAGVLGVVECSKQGALDLVQVIIAALVANQGTYMLMGSGQKPAVG